VPSRGAQASWIPPESAMPKINVDAAVSKSSVHKHMITSWIPPESAMPKINVDAVGRANGAAHDHCNLFIVLLIKLINQ
jgi:hypothetical protein